MRHYIQLGEGDTIVAVTSSSQPIDDPFVIETAEKKTDWLGHHFNRATGVATPPEDPSEVALPRKITRGAFQRRIGVMNVFAINNSVDQVCIALRSYLATLSHVDLDDPETALLLGLLASSDQPQANPVFPGSGPMTEGLIAAILAAPVQDGERPT